MVRAFLKTYKTKYLLGFKPKVMMGEDIDESPSSPVQMCLFLFFIYMIKYTKFHDRYTHQFDI